MGVYRDLFDNYSSAKAKYFTPEMSLLELGDQDIIFNDVYSKFRDKERSYYKKWASLDLHDRAGVTALDLADVSSDIGQWDIITNFGTSEHVEPEQGHYNCWLNIHRWTKVQGYSMHDLPEVGSWPNHCRYYYNLDFFNSFTDIGYEILHTTQVPYPQQGNLVFCLMKKIKEVDFFDYNAFNKLISIDTNVNSATIASENNPKNLKF